MINRMIQIVEFSFKKVTSSLFLECLLEIFFATFYFFSIVNT